MYEIQKYIDLIKQNLSEYRYHHSMCVAKRAKELAHEYNLDEEKAYLAGVLHDVCKEKSYDEQIEIIEKYGFELSNLERKNPKTLHQISGAAFVKGELKIDDEDIVSGIRYHTTGKANMSLFEMIIYLADFTSEDRNYSDVDIMRQETNKGLFDGMIYSLRYTIIDIASNNRQIHPDTIMCYNWVLDNLEK